jgi:hypothetical protein
VFKDVCYTEIIGSISEIQRRRSKGRYANKNRKRVGIDASVKEIEI